MPNYTAKISSWDWWKFEQKFVDFCRKAVKLGYTEPVYVVTEDQFEKADDHETILASMHKFREVVISYDMPIIKGWRVIGNRERIDTQIFTKSIDDIDLTSFHKSEVIGCEHCNTNRYRKKSILLKNEKSGTVIEVGSTCVADFLGHKISNVDLFMDNPFLEGEWGTERGAHYFNLHSCLEIASFYIRKFGYRKSNDEGYTTKKRVLDCHYPEQTRCDDFVTPIIGEKEEEEAADTLVYFMMLDPDDYFANEYMTNLIKITKEEYVSHKLLGYVVSMITAYQRHLEQEVEKKGKPESNYIGEVKERIKGVEVKLVFMKSWANAYGTGTNLLKFEDAKGNMFVTFYTGDKEIPVVGEHVKLTGTIVEHTEYNEVKQTRVNRIIIKFKEE